MTANVLTSNRLTCISQPVTFPEIDLHDGYRVRKINGDCEFDGEMDAITEEAEEPASFHNHASASSSAASNPFYSPEDDTPGTSLDSRVISTERDCRVTKPSFHVDEDGIRRSYKGKGKEKVSDANHDMSNPSKVPCKSEEKEKIGAPGWSSWVGSASVRNVNGEGKKGKIRESLVNVMNRGWQNKKVREVRGEGGSVI